MPNGLAFGFTKTRQVESDKLNQKSNPNFTKEIIMKNIFDLHQDILTDYKSYIDSFINIADEKILNTVTKEFNSGNLYPEPLGELFELYGFSGRGGGGHKLYPSSG